MSNKTQLQTNNANLDTLIARVNAAKNTAASLPEAGGGGSVEMCTVEIVADAPVTETRIYWLDENYTPQNKTCGSMELMMGITLTVPKYSPIWSDTGQFVDTGGMSTGGLIKMNTWAFFVTDNCTFVIS